MKLVRVPEFKNNPLYLLALKMLRFDYQKCSCLFPMEWKRRRARERKDAVDRKGFRDGLI